jgi:PAS domain S-box-containing protein
MLGIVQDISDRKKAEEALREGEERYRRLVNAVTAYTYSVEINDGQAVSTSHSLGCLSITGYSPEDYDADPYLWHSMIYSGDRLMVDNSIRDMLKGREVSPFEHRLVRRDGKVVWVRNTMVPHRDERGQVIRYDGLIEDITERKEAEKALQDSRAKYAAIVEGFDGFIYICAENNDILFMNERLIEQIGYDATGQKCYRAIHGFENVCPWCEHQRIDGNRTMRGELHNPKDNRWYYTVSTPVHNQDGGISKIIMVQDITDKRENELRLIMSERLAALGLMASGIAHEINNPLASIAACAEGLLNRIRKGQLSQELFENYLKIINEEVIRCKSITTSMLSFVRKTPYEKKDVDIHSVIEKVLELIGFQGRLREVKVVKNFEGPLIVRASEGELKQVFLSVIVNALDAMDDTGSLTIGTGVVPHDHFSEDEGDVFIKVTDTGPGIPAENVDKIFDPFYTTRTGKGGTGLGLSIAHKIIKDHNGSISVTSEKGKGTSFTITLPK